MEYGVYYQIINCTNLTTSHIIQKLRPPDPQYPQFPSHQLQPSHPQLLYQPEGEIINQQRSWEDGAPGLPVCVIMALDSTHQQPPAKVTLLYLAYNLSLCIQRTHTNNQTLQRVIAVASIEKVETSCSVTLSCCIAIVVVTETCLLLQS